MLIMKAYSSLMTRLGPVVAGGAVGSNVLLEPTFLEMQLGLEKITKNWQRFSARASSRLL